MWAYRPPFQPQPALPAPKAEDGTLKLKADLASVFEDLLRCVWEAEANWRWNDRLDLQALIEGWD